MKDRDPYPFHRHRYTADDLRRMHAAVTAGDRARQRRARIERQWRLVTLCVSVVLAVGLFYGAAVTC